MRSAIKDLLRFTATRTQHVLTPEIGRRELVKFTFGASSNPDPLLEDLGEIDVSTYQDMLREPVLRAAISRKIQRVISQDWHIAAAPTEYDKSDPRYQVAKQRNEDIAAFIRWNLGNFVAKTRNNQLETVVCVNGFRQGLFEMGSAIISGYSITEMVMQPVDKGRWVGKVAVAALKGKDPTRYTFELDDYDNIRHVVHDDDGDERKLDPTRFLILPYWMLYGNNYGNADLQDCYRAWFFKKLLLKIWAVGAERHGLPTPMARLPVDAPDNQRTAILSILRNIQSDSTIVLPEGIDIEFLQSAMTDGAVFRTFVDYCDKQMLMAIEGAFLHMAEGTQTGARNMGLVHSETSALFAWWLSHLIEQALNQQLIPRLVDLNFQSVAEYPRLTFTEPGDTDRVKDAQVIQTALTSGIPLKADEVYERIGMTRPEEDDDVIEPQAPAAAPPGFPGMPQMPGLPQ